MIELAQQLAHQQTEGRPLQQLQRVGRQDADRHHEQARDVRRLVDDVLLLATAENAAQARGVRHAEQLMLAGAAEIGVHDQRAPAQLGQHDAEIGHEVGAAVAAVRADHRHRPAGLDRAEDPHHQLAADRPEGLGTRTEGLRRGDQLRMDVPPVLRRVGIVELLAEGKDDVGVGRQSERDSSLSEAHAMIALVGQDGLDLLFTQALLFADQIADAAILASGQGRLVSAGHGGFHPEVLFLGSGEAHRGTPFRSGVGSGARTGQAGDHMLGDQT